MFPLHLLLLCLPSFLLIIFSPLLPMYSTPSFSSTSSLVPLILRFPSHSPSALDYTPHFPILPLVLPLLPFPLPVMLRSSSPSLPHHHNPSLVRALFLHIFPTYIFVSLFLSIFLCFFLTVDYSLVLVLIILSPLFYHSSTCSVSLVLLRVSHPTAVLLSPFR